MLVASEISSTKNDASNSGTSGCSLTIRSAAFYSFLLFQRVRDGECDTQTLLGFWEPTFKKPAYTLQFWCKSGLGNNQIELILLPTFLFCHKQFGQMFLFFLVSDCSSGEERLEKIFVEELLSQKPLEFPEQTMILLQLRPSLQRLIWSE